MDTILETSAAVETVRQSYDPLADAPDPRWVRGECPTCGAPVVANCYYVGGRGYICAHECWASLGAVPTCNYRKIL